MSDHRKKAFEVKWRIENLKSWYQTRDDPLYSPEFLAEMLTNTRWKLSLSRKWYQAQKYISLALERDVEDDHPEHIDLNYELSLLACDGSVLKSRSCKTKFAPKTVSQELNMKEVEILEEKKEAYFPKGVLTLCCKLWKAWSTVSKGEHCTIRSVIGRKCVSLDCTIDFFSELHFGSNVTVNFMSTSSEINFISFDVSIGEGFCVIFEKVKVICKFFNSYSCKLFALGANGQKIEICNSTNLASLLTSHKSCKFHIEPYYRELKSYLKSDTLTLQLEITYSPGVESECIEYGDKNYERLTAESADLENVNTSNSEKVHSHPLDYLHLSEHKEKTGDIVKNESSDEDECFDAAGKRHLPSTTLKKDLRSLYNDRLFCDTKLRTDTETFPAHRNVLSARSPVFKKMFTTDMKEKAGECINVPDISSDTVRRMLQFLYTDCTGDLEIQSAKDLYIASDKYDIASLKQRCSSFMKKNLCSANVCDVLVLADMHQDKNLESAAQEYVLTNDEEVFYSDEWKLFMKNYSGLAAQVMYLKFTKK